uniref:V-type proton ATPase subunit S1/VOA1 transmembrane domain-containing protein n=1 Tax=Caenorhabditis japonica TaxID=281687 RepID=A0A8R1DVH1_CAEJA
MRVLIAVFSLFIAVHAYDAVLFSNQREIAGVSVEQLVSSATAEEPIVFIVNPDFTLGQFSVRANAYSAEPATDYLAKSVKNSNFHESQYFPSQVEATSAQVITSADQYKAGSAVYVLAGEEWVSMEQLAEQIISKIDNSVGIITATDAVSHDKNRVKRVATDEMDDAGTGGSTGLTASTGSNENLLGPYALPLVLPPYNKTDSIKPSDAQSCLFYLEGVTVVVQQKNDKVLTYSNAYVPGNNLTYKYLDGADALCVNTTVGEYIFRLRLTLTTDVVGKHQNTEAFTLNNGDSIDLTLNITGDVFGYWSLKGATLHSAKITGKGTNKGASVSEQKVGPAAVQYAGINSVQGWSLVCGQTQAIFFPTSDDNIKIGIALVNTQIQTFNVRNPDKWRAAAHFTLQTEDCTGTFSPGSWMGIVSALVLIGGLLFGYVMLQSVQTMDRFDDPKQKQIVINVRE